MGRRECVITWMVLFRTSLDGLHYLLTLSVYPFLLYMGPVHFELFYLELDYFNLVGFKVYFDIN